MFRSTCLSAGLVILLLFSTTASAATFVVPPDRAMVDRAEAVVIATPLDSRVRKTDGVIETVTTLRIEEVIKGNRLAGTVEVVTAGGTVDEETLIVSGMPSFRNGERVILFLNRTPFDTWAVADLALGKFALGTDSRGRKVAVRQETDINGWTIRGEVHEDPARDAEKFLAFVRAIAAGRPAHEDYYLPKVDADDTTRKTLVPETNADPAASTYLFPSKPRWNAFPQTYVTGTANVTGAPGNGVTGAQEALAIWTDDAASNVIFQHGGTDTIHTNGVLGAADQVNSILFERDLSGWGAGPFSCASGGVLGIGQVRAISTPHQGPGGDYQTATEGDVEMNQGIAGCNWVVGGAIWKSALAHEIGHTLGFRHADQNQSGGSCDPNSMECVPPPQNPDIGPHAVMRSSIANIAFALQTYDVNAVRAVYPAAGSPPLPPTNVQALASTGTDVFVSWSGSDGATSYNVWRTDAAGISTNLGAPAPPAATSFLDITASANSGYFYQVTAINANGTSALSGADIATTVIFTDPTLTAGMSVKAVHLTELRTAATLMHQLIGGITPPTYTDPTITPGVTVIKSEHFTEVHDVMRNARLSQSMSVPAPIVFTAGGVITASQINAVRTLAQ